MGLRVKRRLVFRSESLGTRWTACDMKGPVPPGPRTAWKPSLQELIPDT